MLTRCSLCSALLACETLEKEVLYYSTLVQLPVVEKSILGVAASFDIFSILELW